jgi:signal transduction histidine kinase
VLVNLALNAVQAMEPSAARRLWLRGLCQGGRVVFEVVDSGPGIPEAELKRVREAFYTRRKGGTGLGLAIADRIVGAHGGALELANRLDGGLVARVVLPTDFGNAAS